MKPLSDQDLATELRALRPQPALEFTTKLDARVAAGFENGDTHPKVFDRLRAWLRPTRHPLLTATAAGAVAAVAIATVVIAPGSDDPAERDPSSSLGFLNAPEYAQPEAESGASGAAEAIEPQPQGAPSSATGPYASQTRDREVERSATIFLRTEVGDVRRASDDVFSAVHAVDGIVLSSSVEEGEGGGASFELLVPSGKLGDALASFSEIAEVASREESTADVTAHAVGLEERLEDSRATVDSLLAQLAAADTEAERAAAEAELRAERRHVAALRSQLSDLRRRTNFAHVSLQVVTEDSGVAAGGDGSWGIGSALDDAGRILEVAAGVALVGLAVLAPLALIALLVWLGRRRWLDASRQRALG